ncbi:MAG TPA: peptidase S41, partial [Firmicutes bacterium]|nr:peptidase S41 [Bacillota bacterium]
RKDEKEERVSRGPGIKIPLVVLIDENTASAAEILSGAIKDRNVGTLIGTKTYGKGVIQTIFSLSDGYGLKLTTERYLTPNLYSLDKKGIEPDIEVKYTDEDLKKGIDPQLNKALEVIKEKIGG